MVKLLMTTLAAALAMPAAAPLAQTRPRALVELAQVRIQQHIVIRVPRPDPVRRAAMAGAVPPPPVVWEEKRTNDCVKTDRLSGAAVVRRDSVDLILTDGGRLRARLGDECPALDFYSGFYLKPNKDGKMCAKRDAFRSRAGGECRIRAFRKLVPAR